MAHYAVPRYVDFVEEIPKTGTQRVQYATLRERGITPSAWDREKAGYQVKR
jgi:crotonobetaine/carnitine-CoA ligase